MKKNKDIYIHIGMPKCASTTLQKNIFSKIPSINYLGKTYTPSPAQKEINKLLFYIHSYEEVRYNEIKSTIHSRFEELIDSTPTVISDEWFGFGSNWYRAFPCDRLTVAKRLKELFPTAKILMIIRNQYDFIKSLFAECKKCHANAFCGDLSHLITVEKEYIDLWSMGLFFQSCEYNIVYKIYADLFSSENINILLFENLVNDYNKFITSVGNWLNIDINTSLTNIDNKKENNRHSSLDLLLIEMNRNHRKLVTMIPPSIRNTIHKIIKKIHLSPHECNFSAEEQELIHSYFQAGNKELVKLSGIDLSSHNYPI